MHSYLTGRKEKQLLIITQSLYKLLYLLYKINNKKKSGYRLKVTFFDNAIIFHHLRIQNNIPQYQLDHILEELWLYEGKYLPYF